jgi:hypothetical protein
MPMRGDRLAPIVALVLSAIVVLTGLWVVGGPTQGRVERRDRIRIADLRNLSFDLRCSARKDNGTLPESLTEIEACNGVPQPTDPLTGERYRYERISDWQANICATFEQPFTDYASDFDQATGCMRITVTP